MLIPILSSILLVLALFAGAAFGQEQPVTLSEAVTIALDRNYEIRAYRHALSAQREDIGIARSSLLPRISFEERFLRTDNPTYSFMAKLNQERFSQEDFRIRSLNDPEAISDFQTTLAFEQPLFAPQAWIGLRMARLDDAAGDGAYRRKREEIAFRVTRTYFSLLTAKEQAGAAERTVEDTREHLRIARVRHDAGLGLYSDVLRASTAVTGAEQRLVTAQKNLEIARRALGLLLGRGEPVTAADVAPSDMQVSDIASYLAAASGRNDLRALAMRAESAKNGVTRAEAAYLPTVGVGGAYQLNDHNIPFGAEGQSWQVTAFLRWTLFDGTRRKHERAQAASRAAETEEMLQGLRDTVSFQVHEAYLEVAEAKKNTELARSALETAEEGTRLVRIRYENSLSPLVDLLDAQISLDQARAGYAARKNEYRIAVANLAYASGTILKDLKREQ